MSARAASSSDPMLLELFVSDAHANLDLLNRGVVELRAGESNPQAALADMARAAHSIKGAARIVGLDAAAEICDAIEACLRRVEEGSASADTAFLDAIEQGTYALSLVAATPQAELGASGQNQALSLQSALESLRAQKTQKSASGNGSRVHAGGSSVPHGKTVKAGGFSQPPTLVDPAIFSLFCTEAETCSTGLSQGILALESGAPASLEDLMRAAHSFKGALRIIGMPAPTRVAHAIEECFVAAQDAKLELGQKHFDALLKAVDLLGELSSCPLSGLTSWQEEKGSTADGLASELHALALGKSADSPPNLGLPREAIALRPSAGLAAEPNEPRTPSLAEVSGDPAQERVVRVAAGSINRLMGLAGESLVESRRVQALTNTAQRLKRRHAELATALESLDRQTAERLEPLAVALLADAKSRAIDCRAIVSEQIAELDAYARRVDDLSDRLYREALKSRMRPFRDGLHGLPRMVRDVARQLDKQVRLEVRGESTDVDRDVLESLEAPLNHLLRNAVDHGIESSAERTSSGKPALATLRLEARHHAGMLTITVSDDGKGIDPEKVRRKAIERKLLSENMAADLSTLELMEFIFLPGFSTASGVTEISGRGVGLDAVRTAVTAASGTVRVSSERGKGTTFHLQLPVTRSVMRAVLARVSGEPYAFPLLRIERIMRVPIDEVRSIAGIQYFAFDQQNISLVSVQQVLGLSGDPMLAEELSVVVIGDRHQRYGLVVDEFLGEHDLVVRPLDPRLGKVQDVAAAAILMDGSPALILDVDDMLRSIEKLAQSGRIDKLSKERRKNAAHARKRILVVDDSITVREAERQLLVNRGYEVDVAVDGVDGWNSVRNAEYDLVISDIDMPRMNGLDLVRAIKKDPSLSGMPVVIVSYKDRSEDRMRGLDAGANYYLTKSSFHDETLIEAVEDLIGSPGP